MMPLAALHHLQQQRVRTSKEALLQLSAVRIDYRQQEVLADQPAVE